jgi:hypothetical protein
MSNMIIVPKVVGMYFAIPNAIPTAIIYPGRKMSATS